MTSKKSKSIVALKQRLASIPRTRCAKCRKIKSYSNPVGICRQCGQKFCYNHLWAGLFRDGMSQNEPLRDVCDVCKDKYGYRQL